MELKYVHTFVYTATNSTKVFNSRHERSEDNSNVQESSKMLRINNFLLV